MRSKITNRNIPQVYAQATIGLPSSDCRLASTLISRVCSLLLLFVACTFVGCQTNGFSASNLPPQFQQPPRVSSQSMNFAGVTAHGASDSIIAPSDLLKVSLATSRNAEQVTPIQIRVADDGTVDVPVVGPVPVAGMEAYEAGQNIASFAMQRGMYRHPIVTVEIEKKAVNRITIIGAVKEPGVHELPRGGSDLMSALAASGGLTEEAGMEIEIVRQPQFHTLAGQTENSSQGADSEGQVQLAAYQNLGKAKPAQGQNGGWTPASVVRINLADQRQLTGSTLQLSDRDVVRVVPRKKEVIHIAGLVRDPGQFEIPLDQDLRLLDAIALAGGKSSPVADRVTVIRNLPNGSDAVVIQASLSKAKQDARQNMRIAAGDTINVEQTPATAVVDAFARFFRISLGVASNTVF